MPLPLPLPDLQHHLHRAFTQLVRILPLCHDGPESSQVSEPPRFPGGPAARWPEGPVCDTCYTSALCRRGACTACGQQRRLIAPPGPGAIMCADCAGLPLTHVCALCGVEDKLFEKGRCARCSLRDRASDLLAGAGAGAIPGLTAVAGAITAARNPYPALNWLRTSGSATILAEIAAGRTALTHQALDAHPDRRAADYLRHMLTAGAVLPARDEALARVEQWSREVLDAISETADRRLVQAYLTWQVLQRLRRRSQTSPGPRTITGGARHQVLAVVAFLAWLRHHGLLLRDTTLDLTDRAAGCLLLLFGQHLSRTAVMTTGQITTRDGQVLVRFGQHEVPVPDSLGQILTDLIRAGRSHTGTGSPITSTWLFPGGMPGQLITPSRLGERLRALGIRAMPGRRAAPHRPRRPAARRCPC